MSQIEQYLHGFQEKAFQTDLITWYELQKRDLPWRKDQDPYKIWVSEIMLQQTRVETVIPYFLNFIEKFPSIQALAEADEEEVLKAWEGLGYYSRVRNLQSAVKEVHEQYQGIVPNDPKEIGKLKGVGPYTKGAILSIAYGIPEPAVDGNVMRVLSRVLGIYDDIAKPSTRKIFEEAVYKLISPDKPSEFNQGLMELGATVCTPTSPACLICPVNEHCTAYEEGLQKELPVKSKKKKARAVEMGAAIFTDEQGYFYINKRSENGLLANLWEFPNVELNREDEATYREQIVAYLEENHGAKAAIGPLAGTIQHIFTHLIWNISVYTGSADSREMAHSDLMRVSPAELEAYAFPVSHQKILKLYGEQRS
ncbi:A/G-specific adenine glycosylase [Metabacillus lacus]|uniref:A/G-specific adenine glycosylase n=1 Tax=Metabacillus lacus TaxID=1983721 RepID=UPI0031B5F5BA